jgi:NRPS condensation-like uncharacterized protein
MREIGFLESLALAVDKDSSAVNCLLRAKFGNTNLKCLSSAVEKARKAQPLFCVVPKDKKFHLTDLPVPVVHLNHDTDWVEIAEKELDIPFDRHSPLVKPIYIQGKQSIDLLFKFHHAIGDGISAIYFLKDILSALNNQEIKRRPFPPSVDSLAPNPGIKGVLSGARVLTGVVGDVLKKPYMLNQNSNGHKIETQAQTKIVFHTLQKPQLTALLERCRQNDTTIQGAIMAAVLLTMHQNEGAKISKINIASPINMRHEINLDDAAGLYISMITTRHQVNRTQSFWKIAKDARSKIVQALDRNEHLISIKLPSLFGNKEDIGERFTGLYQFAALVTNVGNLDRILPTQIPQTVEGICGIPSISMLSKNELGLAVNAYRGTLNLCYLYRQDHIEPSEIIKNITQMLLNVSS